MSHQPKTRSNSDGYSLRPVPCPPVSVAALCRGPRLDPSGTLLSSSLMTNLPPPLAHMPPHQTASMLTADPGPQLLQQGPLTHRIFQMHCAVRAFLPVPQFPSSPTSPLSWVLIAPVPRQALTQARLSCRASVCPLEVSPSFPGCGPALPQVGTCPFSRPVTQCQ